MRKSLHVDIADSVGLIDKGPLKGFRSKRSFFEAVPCIGLVYYSASVFDYVNLRADEMTQPLPSSKGNSRSELEEIIRKPNLLHS